MASNRDEIGTDFLPETTPLQDFPAENTTPQFFSTKIAPLQDFPAETMPLQDFSTDLPVDPAKKQTWLLRALVLSVFLMMIVVVRTPVHPMNSIPTPRADIVLPPPVEPAERVEVPADNPNIPDCADLDRRIQETHPEYGWSTRMTMIADASASGGCERKRDREK